MALRFEWDSRKAQANIKKHGVRFEEAQSSLLDEFALTVYDEAHSDEEDRSFAIGMSAQGRVLVTVYTERGSTIRIITSRKAMQYEIEEYQKQRP
jgi:uncharacterized protein